ncbi:hypothetical protein [Streptomyces melanogenes]|uniref:hypothetical protein n=1 Tax=Streptomyces melanogenes TaxID=67326 RepID=UPI00167C7734|nr:hypothetical protein [Streptomyces melanogenes]GGP82600.1 hypothetical protein GCM10010278_71580 [Streptomyces melanogenes]
MDCSVTVANAVVFSQTSLMLVVSSRGLGQGSWSAVLSSSVRRRASTSTSAIGAQVGQGRCSGAADQDFLMEMTNPPPATAAAAGGLS